MKKSQLKTTEYYLIFRCVGYPYNWAGKFPGSLDSAQFKKFENSIVLTPDDLLFGFKGLFGLDQLQLTNKFDHLPLVQKLKSIICDSAFKVFSLSTDNIGFELIVPIDSELKAEFSKHLGSSSVNFEGYGSLELQECTKIVPESKGFKLLTGETLDQKSN